MTRRAGGKKKKAYISLFVAYFIYLFVVVYKTSSVLFLQDVLVPYYIPTVGKLLLVPKLNRIN